MQFREHKDSLDASLETLTVLSGTKESLLKHINNLLKPFGKEFSTEEISVGLYSTDSRLSGFPSTYIVKGKGYGVLGFTDSPLLND